MMLSLIAAIGENRELGYKNKLLWHLPDDLKRFRELTTGHTIIMGRKTFESIGKALPLRKNIIITRQKNYVAPLCFLASSLEDALQLAKDDGEVFVIGGAEVYRSALPLASKMYLTQVNKKCEADVFFPYFEGLDWRILRKEDHNADPQHPFSFSFFEYERIS